MVQSNWQGFFQYLSHHGQVWWQVVIAAAPKIMIGVVLFLVFYFIAWLVKKSLLRLVHQAGSRRQSLYQLFANIARITILACGLITALGTMGINVTALVTSVGLVGFAVGLALKDPLSNTVSGVLVLFYEPFRVGDRITVNKLSGTVTDINLRYTVLSNESTTVMVPNTIMLSNAIEVQVSSYNRESSSRD